MKSSAIKIPYIPFGKLTIIQGTPGEGTTYFAMMLTAACMNRKTFPNMEEIEPFNVIYQTAEDGMGDTIKPRLIEAGADLSRVMVIDDTEEALTLSDDQIEKAVRQNHVRLVIIDPVVIAQKIRDTKVKDKLAIMKDKQYNDYEFSNLKSA